MVSNYPTPSGDHPSVALMYFNDHEARTVEQAAERIIPGGPGKPGARQAGVVYYIDRTIAGFSTDLQLVYRVGLRELDALCLRDHARRFVDLDDAAQDAVLRAHLGPEVTAADDGPSGDPVLVRLLTVIREHTVEGFFGDPLYGGNLNLAGWRLVGFPGAQWGYTRQQMERGFDSSMIVIKTLSDLRSELANMSGNERFYGSAEK